MPASTYPFNLLNALSDFWQRFFADSDQLQALYKGSAVLMGQAYLDMLSNVLSVSLKDCPVFNKQYYQLVLIREDQVTLALGASAADDRWQYTLEDGTVSVSLLENKVYEPSAALEIGRDFDLTNTVVGFKQDPTDPLHDGNPLDGYARRGLDVAVGGKFDDTTRGTNTWNTTYAIRKGDTLRILDIGPSGQKKLGDYPIVLVRPDGLYVSESTVLPATAPNYVILRRPYNNQVSVEPMTFTSGVATLLHTRLDQGSVRVYAKNNGTGADVVEGVDYVVDYEGGRIIQLTTWAPFSSNNVDYKWQLEVWPTAGASPRYNTTGTVLKQATTTRVVQMALWAPDALVDRQLLANNFGAFIGLLEASSEAYKAFLSGIFQLYILGPVLERIESALNVILGLPVIRDDGETLVSIDTSNVTFNRVTTTRPATGTTATYDFPKSTPLRTDLIVGQALSAFEPLTTAITVTDYIETPDWWYDVVIPPELFSTPVPDLPRRTVSSVHVLHVAGASDGPKAGDPGLFAGCDEYGNQPQAGHPVLRHRLAFVLMDQYFKYHTFVVKFDASVLTAAGATFVRSLDDLNNLVLDSRPKHTYVFVESTTAFLDTVVLDDTDGDVYQPQTYVGANPDATTIYPSVAALPSATAPYALLGLFVDWFVGSPTQPDQVLYQDAVLSAGANGWQAGDSYHYVLETGTYSPAVGVALSIGVAPAAPRRRRLVRVFVNSTVGGKMVIENVDYTVDYVNCTITRLTNWDTVLNVTIVDVALSIINSSLGAPVPSQGDTALLTDGVDPANVRAVYDPLAVDWAGNSEPPTNPRDISLVERAITVKVT